MANNPRSKDIPMFYGPSGMLVSTATLSLVSGSAPTVLEAQGISYTSRGGAGNYTLTLGRLPKHIVAEITVDSATLGIGAQVVTNVAAGTVQVLVYDTASKAALETTGIRVHLVITTRMSS